MKLPLQLQQAARLPLGVGAGSAEGAIDAANILKPALSRGEIQVVGATTPPVLGARHHGHQIQAEQPLAPQRLGHRPGGHAQGQQERPRAQGGDTRLTDRFSRDLTRLAALGNLDPLGGREREVGRVIQILARRTKNNPALIGEPGVGKTAVAEGLALRMASGAVPEPLRGKRHVGRVDGPLGGPRPHDVVQLVQE